MASLWEALAASKVSGQAGGEQALAGAASALSGASQTAQNLFESRKDMYEGLQKTISDATTGIQDWLGEDPTFNPQTQMWEKGKGLGQLIDPHYDRNARMVNSINDAISTGTQRQYNNLVMLSGGAQDRDTFVKQTQTAYKDMMVKYGINSVDQLYELSKDHAAAQVFAITNGIEDTEGFIEDLKYNATNLANYKAIEKQWTNYDLGIKDSYTNNLIADAHSETDQLSGITKQDRINKLIDDDFKRLGRKDGETYEELIARKVKAEMGIALNSASQAALQSINDKNKEIELLKQRIAELENNIKNSNTNSKTNNNGQDNNVQNDNQPYYQQPNSSQGNAIYSAINPTTSQSAGSNNSSSPNGSGVDIATTLNGGQNQENVTNNIPGNDAINNSVDSENISDRLSLLYGGFANLNNLNPEDYETLAIKAQERLADYRSGKLKDDDIIYDVSGIPGLKDDKMSEREYLEAIEKLELQMSGRNAKNNISSRINNIQPGQKQEEEIAKDLVANGFDTNVDGAESVMKAHVDGVLSSNPVIGDKRLSESDIVFDPYTNSYHIENSVIPEVLPLDPFFLNQKIPQSWGDRLIGNPSSPNTAHQSAMSLIERQNNSGLFPTAANIADVIWDNPLGIAATSVGTFAVGNATKGVAVKYVKPAVKAVASKTKTKAQELRDFAAYRSQKMKDSWKDGSSKIHYLQNGLNYLSRNQLSSTALFAWKQTFNRLAHVLPSSEKVKMLGAFKSKVSQFLKENPTTAEFATDFLIGAGVLGASYVGYKFFSGDDKKDQAILDAIVNLSPELTRKLDSEIYRKADEQRGTFGQAVNSTLNAGKQMLFGGNGFANNTYLNEKGKELIADVLPTLLDLGAFINKNGMNIDELDRFFETNENKFKVTREEYERMKDVLQSIDLEEFKRVIEPYNSGEDTSYINLVTGRYMSDELESREWAAIIPVLDYIQQQLDRKVAIDKKIEIESQLNNSGAATMAKAKIASSNVANVASTEGGKTEYPNLIENSSRVSDKISTIEDNAVNQHNTEASNHYSKVLGKNFIENTDTVDNIANVFKQGGQFTYNGLKWNTGNKSGGDNPNTKKGLDIPNKQAILPAILFSNWGSTDSIDLFNKQVVSWPTDEFEKLRAKILSGKGNERELAEKMLVEVVNHFGGKIKEENDKGKTKRYITFREAGSNDPVSSSSEFAGFTTEELIKNPRFIQFLKGTLTLSDGDAGIRQFEHLVNALPDNLFVKSKQGQKESLRKKQGSNKGTIDD